LPPFLHVFFASISDPVRLAKHKGILFSPLGFTLRGYELVFKNPNILTGYMNTIIYVVAGTLVNLIATSIAAYVVSRKNALWASVLMFIITFTMFFSGGLIPYYLLIDNLGLINKRLAMIIPGAIGTWNLIVMRTSFMQIPDSMEESARIII